MTRAGAGTTTRARSPDLWLGERHSGAMGAVAPKMDARAWQCGKSPQIDMLPSRFLRTVCTGFDSSREVPNSLQLEVFGENSLREGLEIEPSKGRVFQRPVVEIEGVDVDVGLQGKTSKNSRGHLAAASHPTVEAVGVVTHHCRWAPRSCQGGRHLVGRQEGQGRYR